MPNTDNKFGTFNKRTHIYSQQYPGCVEKIQPIVFANVDGARDTFMLKEMQTVYDECCTTLQWALVKDEIGRNTKLKVTFDFGLKGGVPLEEEWSEQFITRNAAIGGPNPPVGVSFTLEIFTDTDSVEHLF